jgi:UDP-N-acetylglucosamine 2-epimerase (non-hydrolysing)
MANRLGSKNMSEKKIKILTIFGTRKELIRLHPVLEKLIADDEFESIVVSASEHQEEFDDLYDLFHISVDHDLNIKRNKKFLADITSLALSGIDPLIKHYQPDLVLVQGESTSAFVGALASFYNKIPVGHIGAGVRTFNKMSSYPQEINSRLISNLSDLHFVPAAQNTQYLLHEGAIPNNIFITGDTIVDSTIRSARRKHDTLSRYMSPDDLNAYKTILVTCQRKENWDEALENLCPALIDLTQAYADIQIIFPLKSDLQIRLPVFRFLDNQERIRLLDPLPYETFVETISRSYLIITDSEVIREEAWALRKPALIFGRTSGPSPSKEEAADGFLRIEPEREKIVVETSRLLEAPDAYREMISRPIPYGDGRAAERTVQAIKYYFERADRPEDVKSPAMVRSAPIAMAR